MYLLRERLFLRDRLCWIESGIKFKEIFSILCLLKAAHNILLFPLATESSIPFHI